MKHKPNVDFITFRDQVLPRMAGSTCDVRRELGSVLRSIPRHAGAIALIADSEWETWLREAPLPDDHEFEWIARSTTKKDEPHRPRDLTNFVSKLQMPGSGSKKMAAALWYRLHYHVEDRRFAERVDRTAFKGKTFSEAFGGIPVFEAVPQNNTYEHKRLPPSYPRPAKLHESYQFGRPEFLVAKEALLSAADAVEIRTVAIYGAGGYGKTSIAEELCLDEQVRAGFPGGIYWLQFGMIHEARTQMYDGFVQVAAAIENMLKLQFRANVHGGREIDTVKELIANLENHPLLLVADDIWTSSQYDWVGELEPHVTVLFATRNQGPFRHTSHLIKVDRLAPQAAYALIADGMSGLTEEQKWRLEICCNGFNGWALILRMANAVFKSERHRFDLDDVISQYETFLSDQAITEWDVEGSEELIDEKRRTLVKYCMEAGLAALASDHERRALMSLAVFPNDADLPLDVIAGYWATLTQKEPPADRISMLRTYRYLAKFDDLSFLRNYDPLGKTIRLHDEILAYLRDAHHETCLRDFHLNVVEYLNQQCERKDWALLPKDHNYGWTYLLFHLEQSGNESVANKLRVNYLWIKAKLLVAGASGLHQSYSSNLLSPSADIVRHALNMANGALVRQPLALAHQIFGRLGSGPIDFSRAA